MRENAYQNNSECGQLSRIDTLSVNWHICPKCNDSYILREYLKKLVEFLNDDDNLQIPVYCISRVDHPINTKREGDYFLFFIHLSNL